MKVSLSQEGSNSETASRSHEDYRQELIRLNLGTGRLKDTFRIILRTLRITENQNVSWEDTNFICTHAVSESNGSSRFGSGSKVVISQVVVGPAESSAL